MGKLARQIQDIKKDHQTYFKIKQEQMGYIFVTLLGGSYQPVFGWGLLNGMVIGLKRV